MKPPINNSTITFEDRTNVSLIKHWICVNVILVYTRLICTFCTILTPVQIWENMVPRFGDRPSGSKWSGLSLKSWTVQAEHYPKQAFTVRKLWRKNKTDIENGINFLKIIGTSSKNDVPEQGNFVEPWSEVKNYDEFMSSGDLSQVYYFALKIALR